MISLDQFRRGVLTKKPLAVKRSTAVRRDAGTRVRLIEPAIRPPATAVEGIIFDLLSREGDVAWEKLLTLVAAALFRAELRAGAWAVDVGLFGSGLFVPEARRALETSDGELWEIHGL